MRNNNSSALFLMLIVLFIIMILGLKLFESSKLCKMFLKYDLNYLENLYTHTDNANTKAFLKDIMKRRIIGVTKEQITPQINKMIYEN